MLIDSHTHLYLPEFDPDREQMIQRALNAGVKKMVLPNIDSHSVQSLWNLADTFPENCFPAMGLHPCSVNENYQEELKITEAYLFQPGGKKYFAIGEMGLDFYWYKTFTAQQKKVFLLQCEWAVQLNLPIIIHSREATGTCIEMVKEFKNEKLTGVFHCFSGTLSEAHQIIDLGFYLGIGGVLTFKKSGLDAVIREIGLKNILLETDSPYLAPVPYRGKRNESSYIPLIAQKLAEIKDCEFTEVENITTLNAEKLFKFF